MAKPDDGRFLRLALDEAKKCIPTPTAYCVGCVIVHPITRAVLASGYSRELQGNTHAEENALTKLSHDKELLFAPSQIIGLDLYATMEPCSERLSRNKPCTDRILETRGSIGRVVLGVREPDTFVRCVGVKKLQDHGIVVVGNEHEELERECLEVARRGH
jgi:pyrimidine deaminase RibD-like protein